MSPIVRLALDVAAFLFLGTAAFTIIGLAFMYLERNY